MAEFSPTLVLGV